MKFNTGLVVLIVLCVIVILEAYPMINGNIDYLEALRRMRQVPQWHCMRYRRFQLHSPCSRWWMMRRT
ncbi:hypothetical protein KGM_203431 [Danaus plexippus plexippus]|uniref:Seminal fluid protein n=1 Tax=Danaus plexippus plexippus TaxID=278856 RepID=A0A212F389_DANPL|nr:hypothetical protein KGM_203431 [Danaus plexippus plexippus]